MEDIEQQNLVHRYLEQCGRNVRDCRFERAAKGSGGSGEKYVRDQYPREVQTCRSKLGKGASALLVVMVDADMETTQHRASQLSEALRAANMPLRDNDEPIVVLIPKRQVETWIKALRDLPVDEVTPYKKPKPTPGEIREAAERLHEWTRPNAAPVPHFRRHSLPLFLSGKRSLDGEWRTVFRGRKFHGMKQAWGNLL